MRGGVKVKWMDTRTLPFTKTEVEQILGFLRDEQQFKKKITKYRFRWDYYTAACILKDTGLSIKHLLEVTVDQCNLSKKQLTSQPAVIRKKAHPGQRLSA
jgi:hypothetical protein